MFDTSAIIAVTADFMASAAPIALFVALCVRCIRMLVHVFSGREELL